MVKVNVSAASGFDWKIALKKFGLNVAIALITGAVIIWQEDPRYVAIIPLAQAILNWLKNR